MIEYQIDFSFWSKLLSYNLNITADEKKHFTNLINDNPDKYKSIDFILNKTNFPSSFDIYQKNYGPYIDEYLSQTRPNISFKKVCVTHDLDIINFSLRDYVKYLKKHFISLPKNIRIYSIGRLFKIILQLKKFDFYDIYKLEIDRKFKSLSFILRGDINDSWENSFHQLNSSVLYKNKKIEYTSAINNLNSIGFLFGVHSAVNSNFNSDYNCIKNHIPGLLKINRNHHLRKGLNNLDKICQNLIDSTCGSNNLVSLPNCTSLPIKLYNEDKYILPFVLQDLVLFRKFQNNIDRLGIIKKLLNSNLFILHILWHNHYKSNSWENNLYKNILDELKSKQNLLEDINFCDLLQ